MTKNIKEMTMKIVNDYHMHTKLSPCSGDQEATIENFVKVLAAKGFKSICITDHYWTLPENIWENRPNFKGPFPETLKQILENKKMVESTDFPLKVLVGAEIETYSPDCIGGTLELKEMLDVVLLPTDHFHLTSIIQQPEDHSFAGWGKHMMKFFIAGAKSRVGHVLAHPFIPMGEHHDKPREVLDTVSDADFFDALSIANEYGNAIEINSGCLVSPAFYESLVRPYTIAKKAGCKFTVGSDTHRLATLDRYDVIVQFCKECGITEDDFSDIMIR